MASKLENFDLRIDQMQAELATLNKHQNEIWDARHLTEDYSAHENELDANLAKASTIRNNLVDMQARREKIAEEDHAAELQAKREQRREETFQAAAQTRELVSKRVTAGRSVDEAIKALGAALEEIATIDATINDHARGLRYVAYLGHQHAAMCLRDQGNNSGVLVNVGGNALVSQLMAHRIGSRGITAPILYSTGSVHDETVEAACIEAAKRSEQLIAGWLRQAYPDADKVPAETVRVRAMEDGYDGTRVRTEGEVFDLQLRDGEELPHWAEMAEDDAEIDKPEAPVVSVDDLRAMNPGSLVRMLRA
jgi:hypothetical protein